MEEKQKSVFREKNLKKATDPEALNSYLKVTGFSAWFVVLAVALVLIAILVWAIFGKIQPVIQGAGYCYNGVIECYFPQEDISSFNKGSKVDVEGNEGTVTKIDSTLFMAGDLPYEVQFLLPDDYAEWYSKVEIECDADDGLYQVTYHDKEIQPISFVTEGD